MKIQVKSGGILVDAAITQRRRLFGEICVLVTFGPGNAQWMSVEDKHLILSEDQRKQIRYLPWWDKKSRG